MDLRNQVLDQAYWNERSVLLSESLLDKGDHYYERLAREYDRAISRIETEIEAFYTRFAKENKINYSQSKTLLTSPERKRFMLDVEEYIEKGKTLSYSQEWTQQLENASTVHRTTRLQYIQTQMRQQVEELHAKYNTGLTDVIKDVYTEGFYRNIYETHKAYSQAAPFATMDTQKIKTVIAQPWAPDGSNFSEKIWKDREGLVNYLNKELTQAFIRGESADRLIKEIKKKFNVSSKNAARLVQTETAFFSAMSKLESYKALGYRKYVIVAVMDAKTSVICREMDGEVFDLDDFKPGATANPFHPRCRTTTAPYMEKGGEAKSPGMVKNPETGELQEIPQDMSYKEWYAQFAEDEAVDDVAVDDAKMESDSKDTHPVFLERITPDEIDKKLIAYENGIKDKDVETAYIITDSGNVFRVDGDQYGVSFSGVPLKNAIITHNHPADEWGEADSFSKEDILFLRDNPDIKEMRAVTPFYRYALRLLKPLDLSYHDLYVPGLEKAKTAKVYDQNQHYIMEYLKELGYIVYERTTIN